MTYRRLAWLLAAALCVVSASCGNGDDILLQGSGATFPEPLYKRWFLEFYKLHADVRVMYQGTGSGAGIRDLTNGLVEFGASDAAMSPKEVEQLKAKRGVGAILLPMTAGSVVLCFNVPGGPKELKLSRSAYLGIFQGEITTWDDPLILQANPGATLPGIPVTVIRRAEGSGTTYVFTNHLNTVGKQIGKPWKLGVDKSIEWPNEMLGARGNPGVAALIEQTPGAIGYLEYGYAELAGLSMALLENKAGTYVKATPESSQAALQGANLRDDFRIWVPDPPGQEAYPIVTYTWVLCYDQYDDARKAEALKKVLAYCLTEGQRYSKELGYIPLPSDVAAQVLKAVDRIKP
jgi:phosphate transport system substrate-binding protein